MVRTAFGPPPRHWKSPPLAPLRCVQRTGPVTAHRLLSTHHFAALSVPACLPAIHTPT
jgi:hypothetical protein